MPQMENDVKNLNLPNFDLKVFAQELFIRFCKSLRRDLIIFRKTVPYCFVWSFFSFFRIGKGDAKKIIKMWADLGLITLVKFHGLKLNEDVVEEIISDLANEDTNFWLATAPHGLQFKKEEDYNAEKEKG